MMKPYVFSVGVLLMLSFSLTGIHYLTADVLRLFDVRHARTIAFAIGVAALVALVAALAWSVPSRR
ncbi:putative phage-encoded membrane protein [Burkholderia pseudomallei]|nr:putative phage-encoded membrane protein [Burkholderia pseudomallei]